MSVIKAFPEHGLCNKSFFVKLLNTKNI